MKISSSAMELLSNHQWPGNVRELQHAIEKAVIMSDSQMLKPVDFGFHSTPKIINAEMTLDEMEKRMISDNLRKYNNNISLVAGNLGVTRQTLYNKMKKYHL
jgi:transcriptional regulator with PAS, ATPase and Fis domain